MKYLRALFVFFCVALMPSYVKATDDILAYVERILPFVVVNKDNISGMAIDILNEALGEIDVAIDYQEIIWSRALYESKNKSNIILTGLNRNFSREHQFHWLLKLPVSTNRKKIFLWHLKAKFSDHNKWDFNNASVAVMLGDHKNNYYKSYVEGLGYKANIYPVGSREQVVHMLFKGRVDYILGGELHNAWRVSDLGYDPDMIERGVEIPNTNKGLYIAISKLTDIELVNKIRIALANLEQSGRVSEIMSLWKAKEQKAL